MLGGDLMKARMIIKGEEEDIEKLDAFLSDLKKNGDLTLENCKWKWDRVDGRRVLPKETTQKEYAEDFNKEPAN